MPEMNPMMIYRLDRFGRGGHHRPFNDLGYAGVRIMEAHENYNRQHHPRRNGIKYGDVIEGVNFEYAKKLTAVNEISLAAKGTTSAKECAHWWSSTSFNFADVGRGEDENIAGYKIYFRLTTSPHGIILYLSQLARSDIHWMVVIDNYYLV